MKIQTMADKSVLEINISGRLDTLTAPELEKTLADSLCGVKKLIFDLNDLEYLSSAGLRVLLGAQKEMNKQGEMCIRNVNENIMDIFEVTGFVDILNIE